MYITWWRQKNSKFTKTYWMYHNLPVHLYLPQKLAVVNQEIRDILHRHTNEPAGTQLWQMSPTWETIVLVNEAENPEPPLDYILYVTPRRTHRHTDLFLLINQVRSRSFGVSAEYQQEEQTVELVAGWPFDLSRWSATQCESLGNMS